MTQATYISAEQMYRDDAPCVFCGASGGSAYYDEQGASRWRICYRCKSVFDQLVNELIDARLQALPAKPVPEVPD